MRCLTLGASGTTYTAPADGWITYAGSCSVSGRIHLSCELNDSRYTPSGEWAAALMPVKKGNSITFYYNGTFSLGIFRFYYAEGSE